MLFNLSMVYVFIPCPFKNILSIWPNTAEFKYNSVTTKNCGNVPKRMFLSDRTHTHTHKHIFDGRIWNPDKHPARKHINFLMLLIWFMYKPSSYHTTATGQGSFRQWELFAHLAIFQTEIVDKGICRNNFPFPSQDRKACMDCLEEQCNRQQQS